MSSALKLLIDSKVEAIIRKDYIEIGVPNSRFSLIGEKTKKWNISLKDRQTNFLSAPTVKIKTISQKDFSELVELMLTTEFPFVGKSQAENCLELVVEFINGLIIKINGTKHKPSRINSKSRKLQSDRKKRSKNGVDKPKII